LFHPSAPDPMRFLALATDYDGTIAHHGTVDAATLAMLERMRQTGRKLILVTGRQLPELAADFPQLELFDRLVVENGAVLYRPQSREEKTLADAPPPQLAALLRERGMAGLQVGRVILATQQPYDRVALEAIRELGLELQVIFNKGAVMILPSGVNKATGLAAALQELHLSEHNVIGVGDAENDHAFLERCGCAVAVGNALPALKDRADWVTSAPHGEGVAELITTVLRSERDPGIPRLRRHRVVLGRDEREQDITSDVLGDKVLVVGPSGGGKSTIAAGLFERLIAGGFQTLLVDPEGDHSETDQAVVLGSAQQTPDPAEVLSALQPPGQTVVLNLISVRAADKPAYFQRLLGQLQKMRMAWGRPHCLILDEAHHVLPADKADSAGHRLLEEQGLVAVTTKTELLAAGFLDLINVVIATGAEPGGILTPLAAAGPGQPGVRCPVVQPPDQAVIWRRGSAEGLLMTVLPSKVVRRRHVRKYAQGQLAEEDSFYFEGPERKLRLRAENLMRFIEIGTGVDDDTWMHHLRRHDYSRWFREKIKDAELASVAIRIEETASGPAASRESIRFEIEQRYTTPG
jgi:HAD superfamily hydrolase (TIGR01484 family)